MDAILIAKERTALSENAFYELVIWQVPSPVPGSGHGFKYRLALVVGGECVLRYDNERGKGDHRHIGEREELFDFTTLEALLTAFERDMEMILG
ncbi:toxin-antitoxin system TumE family protein [Aquamicrobium defluvii]|uniref:Uncharacterized protein n=1 Tax=Aquamicrobium defluvii TaxID=69279 RepID=A0A011SWI9_9HYPH|nr:DUF6516 family protein [Aquamicrobium defluvii]EXL03624.1 hypothetical protein BG36_11500 [Aquamicrobium defluvii]EZQ15265.1 hypothetical protein CF98_12700 [Halopseudomonas bauzanensis]